MCVLQITHKYPPSIRAFDQIVSRDHHFSRVHDHDRQEETNDFLYSGCSSDPLPPTTNFESRHIYSCLRKPVTSRLDLGHSSLDWTVFCLLHQLILCSKASRGNIFSRSWAVDRSYLRHTVAWHLRCTTSLLFRFHNQCCE